ncbi:hypothetical protein [Aquisphaera giovannonii]|uniref:hypothetical protein n=1 Tax=Aquisphaera giovannonii TaxID=406548 RepID=UPI0011DF6DC5|nr:hypothetical protein [Aquisphaera giovannonii]
MNPPAARRRDRRIRALLPLLVLLAASAGPSPARAGCGGHVAPSNSRPAPFGSLASASPLDLIDIDPSPGTPPPRCSGPNCNAPTDQPPPAPTWKAPHRIDICHSAAARIRPEGPSWPTGPASPLHSIGRAAAVDPPPERPA